MLQLKVRINFESNMCKDGTGLTYGEASLSLIKDRTLLYMYGSFTHKLVDYSLHLTPNSLPQINKKSS